MVEVVLGKTTKCLNEIKECIDSGFDKPIIYIVPEQFSFESEKNLIKICGKNGIIGAQVLSFKRLAYRVLTENNITINSISDSGKTMLIYYLLQKYENKLQVLKGVSNNIGLVKTVSDEISEFKRYNISPDVLLKLDVKNEYLQMKLNDLSLIYSEYQEFIKNKFIDSNDVLTVLKDVIHNTKSLYGAKIWIDEFDGFIPQELIIINELITKCDVTISMISGEDELFELNNSNIDKIVDKTINKEYLMDIVRFKNNDLIHLEKNIFRLPINTYNNEVKNIFINKYKDSYEEVENVAKSILEFVRDENSNYRFENIAILTRDTDKYKNTIKNIFPKYNIPFFIDDKKELSLEPLILLILSFIDIINNNYKYESVFSYLKTGLTNIDDENDIDLIENYVLKWGIKGKKWEEPFYIEDKNLEKINNIREKIINPIISFKENFSGRKTTKEIIKGLYDFINNIEVYNTILNKIEKLKSGEGKDIRLALEYSQVWNVLINVFDDMAATIGDELISFDKFQSVFKIGVSNYEISVIPSTKDKVIIGDVERTRNNEIKIIFIIGMNDGNFPISSQDEGFINDKERQLLLDNGVEIAKDTKKLLKQDYFNIYKALSAPSDYLYISYPQSDLEGKALRCSFIINQIKAIFPKLKENNSQNRIILSSKASFEAVIDDIRKREDNNFENDDYFYLKKWYENNEKERYQNTIKGLDYKNTIEYMSKDISNKLYGESMNSSVSKLESYMSCPYSFYLRYGLNLKEREIYSLQLPDIGSFLHEIIDLFTKKVLDENIDIKSINKEECFSLVDDITESVLSNFRQNLFSSTGKLRSLSVKLKEQVKKTIWLIVYHIKSGSFNIMGSEVEFGKDKEYPEINIELDDGNKLILSGKVDRIDVAKVGNDKYIRIIDYKSSNKAIKLSNVYYGIQLQLLAYSDAISQDVFKPGGVFYLKLDDPLLKTDRRISKEEVENNIIESLKMNGLAISNVKLIEALDNSFEKVGTGESFDSSILNLKIDKNGKFSKMPVVNEHDFSNLTKHMHKVLKQIGNEILKGNVKNEPLIRKNVKSPCEYCDYYKSCRFDRSLGNKVRRLNELKDEDVINRINN
ncbi:MAG: helicase-exonuclease AddAB subunit AddB [Clostridia bacterium]|nr:helicase-exonuclease AddAB subunit AddB [Clostridia bacterium]